MFFQVTKLNIKCLNEVDCVQHYPTSTVTDLLMNSEQLPEIRRRNSAKNGSSRESNSGTNHILSAAAATSSLDSQSPQTSEGKKIRLLTTNEEFFCNKIKNPYGKCQEFQIKFFLNLILYYDIHHFHYLKKCCLFCSEVKTDFFTL